MPSLFGTRRRLTDFCNCNCVRATRPISTLEPRSDDGLDHLPFLTHHALPCESGDARRAALRPFVMTPVPVLLTCASLPDRDATSNAPPSKLAPRSVVTIDVHRSLDRVKDASSLGASDGFAALASGALAFECAMPTTFPSSASKGHPLSSVVRW